MFKKTSYKMISYKKVKLYNVIFCILLIFRNIISIESTPNRVNIYITSILQILMGLFVIYKLLNNKINYKQMSLIICLVCVYVIGVVGKNSEIENMAFVIILSLFMSTHELINDYLMSSIISLSLLLFMQELGLETPHKNTIGYFLFVIVFFMFFEIGKSDNTKSILIKGLMLTIAFFLEVEIGNRTAQNLIILFSIIYFFKIIKINNSFFKVLIVCLPVIFTIFSIYLAKNYGRVNFITYNVDSWLSGRVTIWNNVWNAYKLQLLPQNIAQYAYGYSFYFYQTIFAQDGFFALGIFRNGVLVYIFYLALVMLALYKCYSLPRYGINEEVYYIILIFTVYSFTEVLVENGFTCILFPLSAVYLTKVDFQSKS